MQKILAVCVLLSLALTGLMFSTNPSSAQDGDEPNELVCPAGALIGDSCVVGEGPLCPEGFDYIPGGPCEQFADPVGDLLCPPGSVPASILAACVTPASSNPADEPPFCLNGTTVRDGNCTLDLGAAEDVACPDGFSIDDELGGVCARFQDADRMPARCPDGARGEAETGCYILVAKGPRRCPAGGELIVNECFEIGEAPLPGPPVTCAEDFALVDGRCLRAYDLAGPFPCEGDNIIEDVGGLCVVEGEPAVPLPGVCPAGDDIIRPGCYREFRPIDSPGGHSCSRGVLVPADDPEDPGVCREQVATVSPGQVCPDPGFSITGGRCFIFTGLVVDVSAPACPVGSLPDPDNGCRKAVATAARAYFCEDPDGALNGTTCVFTAPFANPACAVIAEGRCVVIIEPLPVVPCADADDAIDHGWCSQVGAVALPVCPAGTESFDIDVCYSSTSANCELVGDAAPGAVYANEDELICQRNVAPLVRGQMSGEVRDLVSGEPIFGIQVCARNALVGLESCSFSEADGSYALPSLPPGNYQLRARDFSQRFADGCFGMQDCAEPAFVGLNAEQASPGLLIWLESVDGGPSIPPPQPTPLPTPEPPAPTPTPEPSPTPEPPAADPPFLAGQVFNDTGAPVAVQVCATPLANFFAPVCVTSNADDGSFVLSGLVSSNYTVEVDGGRACAGIGSSCDNATLFGVTASTAVADLRIDLAPAALGCPPGFGPDDSLGGICTAFAPAAEVVEVCPRGSLGDVDACYILVARGPSGECPAGSVENDDGDCRRRVANSRQGICPEEATTSGRNCVYTAPFISVDDPFSWLLVAKVAQPTVYVEPDGEAFIPTFNSIPLPPVNPTVFGNPLVYRVVNGVASDEWAQVQVAARPNGETAWVKSEEFSWTLTQRVVEIDLSDRTLSLRGGPGQFTTTAVIGAPGSRTPVGTGWIEDVIVAPNDSFGPFLLSTGLFSEDLNSFGGGIPKIAIQGTNQPDLLGQAVSNGSIRISNEAIEDLARAVSFGTPVVITD